MRFLLVLLLLSVEAGAAEYWVDLSGAGTGAANGANANNLCAGVADADCAPTAGDTVNLCNASTSQWSLGHSGSDGSPITYNWAPSGCAAASIETSGATSALTLGTRTHVVMNDVTLTQTGTARCLNIPGADDITFNRGSIGPCAQSGTGAEGAVVFSPTVDSDRVVFNATYVTNPTGNCIALVNATGAIDYAGLEFNDLAIEDCGNAAGEHGIRLKTAAGAEATITNPLVSGGTITGTYDYALDLSGSDTTRTDKIVNPIVEDVDISASGEIGPATGLGGGAIRITNATGTIIRRNDLSDNLGNGGGVVMLYSASTLIEDNECSRTVSASNQIDGGGIDIDHGNDIAIVRRNKCWDNNGNSTAVNSGYGLMVLDSTNVKAYSNIFAGNKVGISYNPQIDGGAGQDNEFSNNILCGNDRDGAHVDGDTTANNSEWMNNILCRNGRYGFSVGDADSGQTADYNDYYDNATDAYNNQTAGDNDLDADPQFLGGPNPTTAEGFKPNCLTSPLKDAGTDVGAYQDFTGRYFTGAREIGAYACQGGTPRPTPTARPEITARPDNTARPTADARP